MWTNTDDELSDDDCLLMLMARHNTVDSCRLVSSRLQVDERRLVSSKYHMLAYVVDKTGVRKGGKLNNPLRSKYNGICTVCPENFCPSVRGCMLISDKPCMTESGANADCRPSARGRQAE